MGAANRHGVRDDDDDSAENEQVGSTRQRLDGSSSSSRNLSGRQTERFSWPQNPPQPNLGPSVGADTVATSVQGRFPTFSTSSGERLSAPSLGIHGQRRLPQELASWPMTASAVLSSHVPEASQLPPVPPFRQYQPRLPSIEPQRQTIHLPQASLTQTTNLGEEDPLTWLMRTNPHPHRLYPASLGLHPLYDEPRFNTDAASALSADRLEATQRRQYQLLGSAPALLQQQQQLVSMYPPISTQPHLQQPHIDLVTGRRSSFPMASAYPSDGTAVGSFSSSSFPLPTQQSPFGTTNATLDASLQLSTPLSISQYIGQGTLPYHSATSSVLQLEPVLHLGQSGGYAFPQMAQTGQNVTAPPSYYFLPGGDFGRAPAQHRRETSGVGETTSDTTPTLAQQLQQVKQERQQQPSTKPRTVVPMSSSLGPDAYFVATERRAYRHESFPERLYRMIVEAERDGLSHLISFTADGRAFTIHRLRHGAGEDNAFEQLVSRYFRHKKASSLRRQLSMYGFLRHRQGPNKGAYAHQLFIRGRPDLLKQIKRVSELDLVLPPSVAAAAAAAAPPAPPGNVKRN